MKTEDKFRTVRHHGPIKSLNAYNKRMAEFQKIARELEIYEKEKWPVGIPSLVDLLRARMADLEIRPCDLVSVIGTKSTVSMILSGERKIPRENLLRLAEFLEIDVSIILKCEESDSIQTEETKP